MINGMDMYYAKKVGQWFKTYIEQKAEGLKPILIKEISG